MKVLLSAYACAPGAGSEPEVGWQVLLAALRQHEVWVLTQPHMADDVSRALVGRPGGDRVRVVPVGPSAPAGQAGLPALARTQLSHERWQRAAGARARQLHAEVGFDLVHHATLAAYWMRTGVAHTGPPLVWGPVGGAVEPPLGLLTTLGPRGAVEGAVRTAVRLMAWARPSTRAVARAAEVVLVQNDATARRLSSVGRDVTVLPNAVGARVQLPARLGPRRADVAVVGRVVPWKAVPLAVRALSALADDTAVLRVYGEQTGAERGRVLRAAARFGVGDRVELLGRLARDELVAAVATSGVLLHTSLHDEASFTVAEALSVGTPVVALAHGGPPHVAAAWPGSRVSMVPPGLPAATARRLARAVDEALAQRPAVVSSPILPVVDFGEQVLAAYERAGSGGG